jgi:hypothetical protein
MVLPKFRLLCVPILLVMCSTHTLAQCTIGYTGPNISLWCTCNAGYTGGNFIGPYSTTACGRFLALIPQKPSFASVATRNNAAQGSLPTYDALGGPNGNGHVSFDRTQWLGTGIRTWNSHTNGGLTVLMLLRFSGVSNFETPLHFWKSDHFIDMTLKRNGIHGNMYFVLYNGYNPSYVVGAVVTTNNLVAGWNWIICQWDVSTNQMSIQMNSGTIVAKSLSQAWSDRQVGNIVLGRDFSNTANFGGDIAGAFVVDEYLNSLAITEIYNSMASGVDMTNTICPSGNACTGCPSRTYKNTIGSSNCSWCGPGSTSPVASTSSAACVLPVCDAGYTSLLVSPYCAACQPGTYKSDTGRAACLLCPTGQYSVEGQSACTNCSVGTYYTTTCGNVCSSGCTSCPVGTYGRATGTTVCASCEAGTYSATTGLSACTRCAVGTFQGSTNSTTCAPCGNGASSAAGSTSNTQCVCEAGYGVV